MNLRFSKVIIHHFLSFDHAEIDLVDRGYCQVVGINKNPKDYAKSNGAGKSTIFNAISYALTGETLQGLKSNLANIVFNDGCYVELEFEVNNHKYKLIRSKDDKTYGTDLKIYIDGEDKSGKGIRESSALLLQYLPDLTGELLGSTVLIGQGMPTKFTANSPSGRKEVLEHLSQSDFMIQDLKNRIAKRISELANETRVVEDKILELTTQNNIYNTQLNTSKEEFNNKFNVPVEFDVQLKNLNEEKITLVNKVEEYKKSLQSIDVDELNKKLFDLTKEKNDLISKFSQEHNIATEEFNQKLMLINTRSCSLDQEITKLKNIKDICPTCGQKIPNVIKQDTSRQEQELKELKESYNRVLQEKTEDSNEYQEVLKKVDDKFDANIQKLSQEIALKNQEIRTINSNITTLQSNLEQINTQINNVTNTKNSYEENKQRVLNTINSLTEKLETIKNTRETEDKKKTSLEEHNDIVSKMNTIIKRDFRGFLLKNVIDYINTKVKEYASQIFGCDEVAFELDGNDINISFCGKDYENLSGGEKQRLDLVIQFAIRNFLVNYLQFSSNILVLDEITDALDSESCDRVMNFITNELKDIESVFIISHHDELELPVDSQIVIEKSELGVSNVIHQE